MQVALAFGCINPAAAQRKFLKIKAIHQLAICTVDVQAPALAKRRT